MRSSQSAPTRSEPGRKDANANKGAVSVPVFREAKQQHGAALGAGPNPGTGSPGREDGRTGGRADGADDPGTGLADRLAGWQSKDTVVTTVCARPASDRLCARSPCPIAGEGRVWRLHEIPSRHAGYGPSEGDDGRLGSPNWLTYRYSDGCVLVRRPQRTGRASVGLRSSRLREQDEETLMRPVWQMEVLVLAPPGDLGSNGQESGCASWAAVRQRLLGMGRKGCGEARGTLLSPYNVQPLDAVLAGGS
ncbi:hypothetical protein GGR56DRAFT_228435 [Xylariaceae sp. FL0804]|nr:hypothetical protein GGR56DRAFT_228435 [Xylariaceae sp. FL0804]